MPREISAEAIRKLGFLTVKTYLLARGWQRIPGKREDVGIFRPQGSDQAEVLLPLHRDFADVDEALARAVEEIARFEQRPVSTAARIRVHPVKIAPLPQICSPLPSVYRA